MLPVYTNNVVPAALKKKHSKTGEDSKYHATILGKGNDQGEVLIEGTEEFTSIQTWERSVAGSASPPSSPEVKAEEEAATPSSTLSSVPEKLQDPEIEMDLS